MKLSLILLFIITSLSAFSQSLFNEGDSTGTIIGKVIGIGLVVYLIIYFIWIRKKKV